jgi:lipopolysaccharide/colanic/teichoic acid biosynthesis glycosyltransferase
MTQAAELDQGSDATEPLGRRRLPDRPQRPRRGRSVRTRLNAKRILDVVLGLAGLVAATPVILAAAVAMRQSGDRGPVFYRARRVGEGGKSIVIIKLRTMRADASGAPITVRGDPRVTRVGRALRRFKLDELPQLWCVVRGDMSLVGPRPEDPRYVDWADPLHRQVFSARPGITGLAQLRYHDEESLLVGPDQDNLYRSVVLPAKLRLDRAYLERRSLGLDLCILAQTAGAVLSARPRWVRR